MVFSIQGPASASVAAMPSSLGMNDSVISLICVAAWKMPTNRPTVSPTSRIGAASISVTSSACVPMLITVSGVMAYLFVETRSQGAHHQRPAVHQHEQHDLEGQRDQHRRQHHHAHRHQHAGHDEIDDHEGNEDHEADLEGGLQLA